MNDMTDYKLANLKKKEQALADKRRQILAQEDQNALDSILGAPAPATLIQSFPDQDLYYLMHKIGPLDFIPVLAMATSSQWEYIIDLEVWDNDRVDLKQMTKLLDLLFQADSKRLLRWMVKEKPDFIEYYFYKYLQIHIREHDEPPPDDHENYVTWDDKFYLSFLKTPRPTGSNDQPAPEPDEKAPELIEKMLRAVAEMDLSVFHGLLLETASTMTVETEEEQFRQKNLRLAEKGFLPFHEALGIYQPINQEQMRKRPKQPWMSAPVFDPENPLPPQYHSQYIKGTTLFEKSLEKTHELIRLDLESELASLINKLISADKVKIRKRQDIEAAVWKTMHFLSLGIESLNLQNGKTGPQAGAAAIETYFLEDIFRCGSARGIALKTMASKWYNKSFIKKRGLPISFLGEQWLGVMGGLLLDRPMFFDNYEKTTGLYRNFETLDDIEKTHKTLQEVMETDHIVAQLDPDLSAVDNGMVNIFTCMLTLWAKDRLGLELSLEPVPVDKFRPFFKELFADASRETRLNDFISWICGQAGLDEKDVPLHFKDVTLELFRVLDDEYRTVDPERIDPRYIPHFLLCRSC